MRNLIESCVKNDERSWNELWGLIVRGSRSTVERVLWAHGLPASLADDVLQSMYIYIRYEDYKRLNLFRGESTAEFGSFARVIARRFATRSARRWKRERDQEQAALRVMPRADRFGPADWQIRSAYEEIVEGMTERDRRRLGQVEAASIGRTTATGAGGAVPARTIRYWSEKIIRVYFQQA